MVVLEATIDSNETVQTMVQMQVLFTSAKCSVSSGHQSKCVAFFWVGEVVHKKESWNAFEIKNT